MVPCGLLDVPKEPFLPCTISISSVLTLRSYLNTCMLILVYLTTHRAIKNLIKLLHVL